MTIDAALSGAGSAQGGAGAPAPGSVDPAAAASAASAGQANDWTTGLAEDVKGIVATKGWKAPGDIIQSYVNLEKLKGAPADRLIVKPDKARADDPEAWKAYDTKVGVPADPAGYELKIDGAPAEAVAAVGKLLHSAGVPKDAAAAIVAGYQQMVQAQVKQEEESFNRSAIAEESALKTEWGPDYDKKMEIAKRAFLSAGFKPEVKDANGQTVEFAEVDRMQMALGTKRTYELLSKLGEALVEHSAAGFDGRSGGITDAITAQARIAQLRGDAAFVKKFADGDLDARAEMSKLQKIAYPGNTTI